MPFPASVPTRTSPVHRLDPRVKLLITLVFMVSCLFIRSAGGLAAAGLAVGTAAACARIPLGRLLAQLRPVVILLAVTSLINLFFVQTGEVAVAIGPVRIFTGGIAAALLYTLRFLFLLIAGGLLMLTTAPIALTDAVETLLAPLSRRGLPVGQAMLILSIALRFVPTLAEEARTVAAAQIARGADLEGRGALGMARVCVPLIVPLFAGALRHADNLGRAMAARCYTGEARTRYRVMRVRARRDAPAVLALALYLAALIALNVLGI